MKYTPPETPAEKRLWIAVQEWADPEDYDACQAEEAEMTAAADEVREERKAKREIGGANVDR